MKTVFTMINGLCIGICISILMFGDGLTIGFGWAITAAIGALSLRIIVGEIDG